MLRRGVKIEKKKIRYRTDALPREEIDPVIAVYTAMRLATTPRLGIPMSFINKIRRYKVYAYIGSLVFEDEYNIFPLVLIHHTSSLAYREAIPPKKYFSILSPETSSQREELLFPVSSALRKLANTPNSTLILAQAPTKYLYAFWEKPGLIPDKPWTKHLGREYIPATREVMSYVEENMNRLRESIVLVADGAPAQVADFKEELEKNIEKNYTTLFIAQVTRYLTTVLYYTNIYAWRYRMIEREYREERLRLEELIAQAEEKPREKENHQKTKREF